MATIAPRVSRAASLLSRLAKATPSGVSGGAIAPRAAAVLSLRTSYTINHQTRYTSSQSPPSLKNDLTPTSKSTAKAVLPEFDLKGKVIVVSGGAQGLGLVQTEALLEAGAIGPYPRSPTENTKQKPLIL
jgi:hypothetical protein